eukprot:1138506-Pelagomonas_calceolata.AAC.4
MTKCASSLLVASEMCCEQAAHYSSINAMEAEAGKILKLNTGAARPLGTGAGAAGDVPLATNIVHHLLAQHPRVAPVKAVAAQGALVAALQHLLAWQAAAPIWSFHLESSGRAERGLGRSAMLLANNRQARVDATLSLQEGQYHFPVMAGCGIGSICQGVCVTKDNQSIPRT